MEKIEKQLWQVRTKAFLVQLGSMVAVALTGVITSGQFKDLVTENFGTSFVVGASLLFLTGLASHIANKLAIKKLGTRVGGGSEALVGWNDINLI